MGDQGKAGILTKGLAISSSLHLCQSDKLPEDDFRSKAQTESEAALAMDVHSVPLC